MSEFKDENEVVKVELINLAEDKSGNAIINFKYETGYFQRIRSGCISSYIITYGMLFFIEYND